jgi:hypothetical protein
MMADVAVVKPTDVRTKCSVCGAPDDWDARYERMRAAYNVLSEELWRIADESPFIADRIRLTFSKAAHAHDEATGGR